MLLIWERPLDLYLFQQISLANGATLIYRLVKADRSSKVTVYSDQFGTVSGLLTLEKFASDFVMGGNLFSIMGFILTAVKR